LNQVSATAHLDAIRFFLSLGRRKPVEKVLYVLLELFKRLQHPLYTYQPADDCDRNQLAFILAAGQKATRLLFGGNQAGKSMTVAFDLVLHLLDKHPTKRWRRPINAWVVAPVYDNIYNGIYRHLMAFIPPWEIAQTGEWCSGYKGRMYQWVELKNGSMVTNRAAKGESGRASVASAKCDIIAVDEEVEEVVWKELQARRLSAVGSLVTVSATMEKSQPWLCQLEERAEAGDHTIHLIRLSSEAAVRAGHVEQSVVDEMKASLTEEDYRVRILGQSRRTMGLVYGDFDQLRSIVPKRRVDEGGMKVCRYVGIDPGIRTCAVVWIAFFENGDAEIYRTMKFQNKNYLEVAEGIMSAGKWRRDFSQGKPAWIPGPGTERIETYYIDPSARNRDVAGLAQLGLADLLRKEGVVPLTLANNDVDFGVNLVRSYLAVDPLLGRPHLFGQDHCRDLLWERGRYKIDSNGKPKKRDDHFMDAMRYVFASAPGFVENDGVPEPLWIISEERPPHPFSSKEAMAQVMIEEPEKIPNFHRGYEYDPQTIW
jgi:hypothetical protein